MDATVQVILAAMISLSPPGKSYFSRMTIDHCDAVCQKTKACESPTILCAEPAFNQETFDQKLDKSKKSEMTKKQWDEYEQTIREASYTKTEDYNTGLKRYITIATAIAEISKELSWANSSENCLARCSKQEQLEECKKCILDHPWNGSTRDLEASLVTVMFGESGFRQDIHSGIGKFAKGDCEWRDNLTHLKVKAFSKGASPMVGTCRSVCLGQINIGSSTLFGFKSGDLVGTDIVSTKHCANAATRKLAQARRMCSGPLADFRGDDWAKTMFSAYGTGNTCRAMVGTGGTLKEAYWPQQRAVWFWDQIKHPAKLDDSAKKQLLAEN